MTAPALQFRRALMNEYPKHLAVLNAAAEKGDWGKPLPAGVRQGDHRALEAALQHDSTALIARLQTAGPRSSTMAGFATRASFAGHPSRSAPAGHALLFNPDHLMGAGHGHDPCACGA